MAIKQKSAGQITLSKPASKKLVAVLVSPHTETQKQTILSSIGKYALYAKKWKSQN